MTANTPHDTDPELGAATPLGMGIAALLLFAFFIGFWAQQRLISTTLPTQGTLLIPTAQDGSPDDLAVTVELDPQLARHVREGQMAVFRLRPAQSKVPLQITGTVVERHHGNASVRLLIEPEAREAPRLRGLALPPGSPIDVSILTGDRSALALLLDPVLAVFSRTAPGTPENGT